MTNVRYWIRGRELSFEGAAMMGDAELIELAIESNSGMGYARVENGLTTRVVTLWRNEDCYLAGYPPRVRVEGFPLYRTAAPSLQETL